MTTRVFLCNQDTWYHGVEDEIREAKDKLSKGFSHRSSWTCGNVRSIQVGDEAYFKRVGSEPLGFFAHGYIVAAEKQQQLRLLDPNFSDVSEAYEGDGSYLVIRYEWDSVVDYQQPLEIKRLREDLKFRESTFVLYQSGHSFNPEYDLKLLKKYWDNHVSRLSKRGYGFQLYNVLYQQGQEKARQGLAKESIEKFTQAVQINPDYSLAYAGRGNAYYKLNEFRAAIDDYMWIIQRENNHRIAAPAYYWLGVILSEIGNEHEAIEAFQSAEQLFLNLGDTINSRKTRDKINEIVTVTEEVLELNKLRENIEDFILSNDISEARKRINISIIQRQGQTQFRDSLIKAYGGCCAITKYKLKEVLEAAHIVPYSENGVNHPSNGLLLRADLHTLFDLNLIAVEPETLKIYVAPNLQNTNYKKFNGNVLRCPLDKTFHPCRDALQYRWEKREWRLLKME